MTLLVAGVGLAGSASATLIDRGGGLIYDTALNITWLADANYAKTSGYDAQGYMNWTAANAWAAGLSYGGYSDWRLPTTLQPDATCSAQSVGIAYGYNCTGSEMGHLFYADLAVTAGYSILTSTDPDLALFQNIQDYVYWSGTNYANTNFDYAWEFFTASGGQGVTAKHQLFFAWAVRSGDVAADVPEPSVLALLGLGLAGLGLARRRKQKAA